MNRAAKLVVRRPFGGGAAQPSRFNSTWATRFD